MKPESRYRYEKRIRELESQVNALEIFRYIAGDIHDAIADNLSKGSSTSDAWIIRQYRRAWK